ncbi:sugar phosphate isomerase/epimerase family protein [Pseudothermotoga thermarum]|uniref:Xylose isomerase domain-containing protein TIM barrel n=1 Tax=Pseudothermotoga thermarum DSM 5069 TaxID=688269 RepID=F7YUG4_9THEM|nr:sugar phosphate isomerase/epimerase [Pseudothermotoga thermarum]AEH51435.1 Xylose isomerase domain-containing protein TIM barrel [Pseudothermotoga thermarum DSM 5069]
MRKGLSTSIIRADVGKIDQLPWFSHYELTFFKQKDVEKVMRFLKERKASFGVHAPFVFRYCQVHPQPTSLNPTLRHDTLKKNQKCIELAKSLGADYVILHFPSAKQSESWLDIYEDIVQEIACLKTNGIQIRIENVYCNDCFHTSNDYKDFLERTNLTICVDIGHLLIDSQIYGLDPVEFVESLKPFISEFHIYYADLIEYEKCHHKAWKNEKKFLQLLEYIRDIDADFVLEPSPECLEGFENLLKYLEEL